MAKAQTQAIADAREPLILAAACVNSARRSNCRPRRVWVGTRAALTLGTGRTIRIAGRKVGVLQTIQKTKRNRIRNDRVIAVPKDSHRERELQGVEDLPSEVKEELEKFFVATDEMEAKTLKFLGWQGPA
jgi:hypothetical protein